MGNRYPVDTNSHDPRENPYLTSFPLEVKTTNTANPPTDANLDAAAGVSPAVFGAGNGFILDDNDGDANVYLVVSNGTSWWYATLAKAV